MKYFGLFSNAFLKEVKVFSSYGNIIHCTLYKVWSVIKQSIAVGYLLFGSNLDITFKVHNFQGNTKLYTKSINAIFCDLFYWRYILNMSKNLSQL